MTRDLSGAAKMIERIGFVGYGYVGSATGAAMADVADVRHHDPAVPGSMELAELARWAHAIFVCVPTPMGAAGGADLEPVLDVMSRLADVAAAKPILLKSTVPPGTCAAITERWPRLRLLYNPEFLRERHHLADARSPARIVLGRTPRLEDETCRQVRALLTKRFLGVPCVEMASSEAELLKYASNAIFAVKVSFANEMHELAQHLGLDWESVRQALVLDPRVGDGHLQVPGPDGRLGFGGSCLPKDTAGLLSVARAVGVDLEVVEAAVRGNSKRRHAETEDRTHPSPKAPGATPMHQL